MQALLNAWVLACRSGDLATAHYLEREVARRVAQRRRQAVPEEVRPQEP
jgi:hypothetical protein